MDEMNKFLNQTYHVSETRQRKKPTFFLDLTKVVSTEQLL